MSLHLFKAIEELADRLDGAAVASSMAEVAAELRAILERYPLPPEDADERDSTHWLFQRHSETLTRVANAVNGPPKPLWSHSHHDLGEKAEAMAKELELTRAVGAAQALALIQQGERLLGLPMSNSGENNLMDALKNFLEFHGNKPTEEQPNGLR